MSCGNFCGVFGWFCPLKSILFRDILVVKLVILELKSSDFVEKQICLEMCEKCLCAVAAFLTDQYMIICHSDIPRVEYAHFTRRPPIMEAAKRLDKLSTWEPKVDLLYIWLIYFMSQYLPALPYVLYKFLTKLAWCHSDFSNEVIYFK